MACPTQKRFRPPTEKVPTSGKEYPRVLLYSFEGSGNTWTRSILEDTSGACGLRLARRVHLSAAQPQGGQPVFQISMDARHVAEAFASQYRIRTC